MKRALWVSGLVLGFVLGLGLSSDVWAWSCLKVCPEALKGFEAAEKAIAAVKSPAVKEQAMTMMATAKKMQADGWKKHLEAKDRYTHSMAIAECGTSDAYLKAILGHVKGQ